jgi:alpha-amylase
LLFWAETGVDGFRCDMVEMVPTAFWKYATAILKDNYPQTIVIGEVYDPSQYRTYVQSGFDYLYDKVGMYDCLKSVVRQECNASAITYQWQSLDDIGQHMLYFLENHDEQRIASSFFCGDAQRAIPALIVSALLQGNPMLIYAGQEFGEPGMDNEGFSGVDGRTTIFDYWTVGTIYRGYFHRDQLSVNENDIYAQYQHILRIAKGERAVGEGLFFDLMYVNPLSHKFNPTKHFAFLRKWQDELLLVVVNFSGDTDNVQVNIPGHAFDYLQLPEGRFAAIDLLTGETTIERVQRDGCFPMTLNPYSGRIYKLKTKMKDDELLPCLHNKDEFPPAHTAEHLLNQVMVRMFDCDRSTNAHVERKKSKISYILDRKPSRQDEKEIEQRMNELIEEDLPVTYELVDRYDLPEGIDLSRVPDDYSNMVRIVRIGDFDTCPCIGKHVRSTAQIGKFVMLGTNWDEETRTFRVRFKLV